MIKSKYIRLSKKSAKDIIRRRKIRDNFITCDQDDPYFIFRENIKKNKNASLLADKLKIKKIVSDIVAVPKTVWEYGQQPFKNTESLILKSNTSSGYNKIIKAGKFNQNIANKYNIKWSKSKFDGLSNGQNHYYDIEYKIYLEELIGDNPKDYKVHLFNDDTYMFFLTENRYKKDKIQMNYDMNFNVIPMGISVNEGNRGLTVEEKEAFKRMVSISKKIRSKLKIPTYARYDYYFENGKIYFGEITLSHNGGSMYCQGRTDNNYIKHAKAFIEKIKL